ncbi:hypothetical protein [Emticicia soli]|uniref:Uncharacterized protein n=1 Tax=Emticicia soli TaxID=2027878 RepID=A0ABW5JGH3_9BACT
MSETITKKRIVVNWFSGKINTLRNTTFIGIICTMLIFSKNEISTLKLALNSKKRKRLLWFANNLIFPLFIIYIPILLTLISHDFGKIQFDKGLLELTITGSFTLLGINVMRTGLVLANEKISEQHIPKEIAGSILEDIESIKAKLRLTINLFTFIGAFLYLIQVGSLLNPKIKPQVYYYVSAIIILSLFSVIIGRFITVIQTNFFDNENLIAEYLKSLGYNNNKDFVDMEQQIKTQGGLL